MSALLPLSSRAFMGLSSKNTLATDSGPNSPTNLSGLSNFGGSAFFCLADLPEAATSACLTWIVGWSSSPLVSPALLSDLSWSDPAGSLKMIAGSLGNPC